MPLFLNDDCFNVMKDMEDNSVDVTFTSPPYNRKRNDKYENYDDTIKDYYKFLKDTINELLRVTERHVIFNIQTNYYNKAEVYKIIGDFADKIQQIIIWEKSNPLPASGNNITNAFEYFLVLGNEPLKSNYTYTKNHITTSKNSETTSKIHKAVMKQEVADWFIDHFTKENDLVFDPFLGLGTTAVSCKKYNRRCCGVELNKEYFDEAMRRISKVEEIL